MVHGEAKTDRQTENTRHTDRENRVSTVHEEYRNGVSLTIRVVVGGVRESPWSTMSTRKIAVRWRQLKEQRERQATYFLLLPLNSKEI